MCGGVARCFITSLMMTLPSPHRAWHCSYRGTPIVPCTGYYLWMGISPVKRLRFQRVQRLQTAFRLFVLWTPSTVCETTTQQVQGAYFDFAGQWTRSHTFKSSTDVVTDSVLRDFKSFVYKRQKEVGRPAGRRLTLQDGVRGRRTQRTTRVLEYGRGRRACTFASAPPRICGILGRLHRADGVHATSWNHP